MRILQLFILVLLGMQGLAKTPANSDYILQQFTEKDGLPNDNVSCSLQTKDGFLWFGTWYGLTRFDGNQFYNFSQVFSIASDQPPRKVETLVEDAVGNIWIKTVDWKLSVLFKKTERFEDVYDELKPYSRNLQIIKIQKSDDGKVLLLTKNKNLLIAHTDAQGQIHIRLIANGKGYVNPVNSQLIMDYVDIRNGYAAYVGRDYQIFAQPLSHLSPVSKDYWLQYFHKKSVTSHRPYPDFLKSDPIKYTSYIYDRKTRVLWLTTSNHGVYRLVYPYHRFRFISIPGENNGVRSFLQVGNRVWVGTRNKDLYILDRYGNIDKVLSYNQYHIGSVYYMMHDGKGGIWLSTKGDGLVHAVPDKSQPAGFRFVHFKHDVNDTNSISGNNVYITYLDSRKRVWVGTLDGGLNLLVEKNGKISFYHKFNRMKGYPGYGQYLEVRNMAEDDNHRMWVGTIDGLMSFYTDFSRPDDIRFETYRKTEQNTIANGDIYALYKDHKQNIWVCTFGGGLARIDGYDNKHRLPRFRRIGTREGLQNDVIVSIQEDDMGNLWLGSSHGVACYNQESNTIRNFNYTDGFPNVTLEETASLLCANGDVWMGTKEGVLAFSPSRMNVHKQNYPVYIVGATVNNQDIRTFRNPILKQSITYADKLELKHNQNMFTLEFAALNYASQDQTTYRYKLEGFDRDWHYSGRNHLASYSNVAPGVYTFTVEAIDASNPEQHSSRSLDIRILPPWWATWWAYTFYTLLFVVILWFVVRYVRFQIRLKNDIYVQSKISEFKRQYELEQADARFLKQVNQIIDDNLDNPDFEIEVIAQQLGMSRSAFFKRLKSLTSQSPSEFIKEYKLSHAVEMLKNSDMSISDIAYQSGFSDVGYFGKCFRKKYGKSPRDFKNNQ